MSIIADRAPDFQPPSSHRVLYVGSNRALSAYLRDKLADCCVVYCPDGVTARLFIARINYSLLLFDEELSHMTGAELAEFNCSLERKPCTPFIIIKKADSCESLVKAIRKVFARASS